LREGLVAATPPPRVRPRLSLGANVAMAMVLVDYTLYGRQPVGPWAEGAAAALPPQARLDLAAVRAVLVHGLVLRDAFLRLAEDPRDWEGLRRIVAAWDAPVWRGLIAEGCASNIAHSGDAVPPGWDAEEAAFLGTVDAVAAEWNAGDRPRLRRLAADPAAFGRVVLDLLNALWEAGAGRAWVAEAPRLEAACRAAEAGVHALRPLPPIPVLVGRITGRHPPEDWRTGWDGVRTVWLVPCFGMGALLARGRDADAACVCYDPNPVPAGGTLPPAEAGEGTRTAAALQALAGAARTGVWQALRRDGEMYAGQIAAVCRAGASAVSRVMGPLEQAGLVRVRRVGPAKFFSIDDAAVEALIETLRSGGGNRP